MNLIKAAIIGITLATGSQAAELPIIPKPLKATQQEGHYTINAETSIRYKTILKKEAELLAASIHKVTGITPKLYDARLRIALPSPITLDIDGDDALREAYDLTVTPKGIKITGTDSAGVFYGSQSLLQLIPLEGEKEVPACQISDQPRFGWRGMHLDVGRHMFAPKNIKKFIDQLAIHKLNTLHWHLTEDQGWRVEIKKYPKLTSVGGFRDSSPPYGNRKGSDGTRYGGFYTQEQIKDIVAYAKDRHITIVPEIDMPGHMAAAIAAYPSLGNDDIKGYNPKVGTRWGVLPYILSPKEETFQWIDDVMTEICELFPSTYIHIGGDEAPKGQWKNSKFAQSVIKREKLHNEHDLQSYFIKRVEKILEDKGRKLIGWDEIREGGLSPSATVMSWRGMKGGIASVKEGHDVVMAPNSYTYFDHYQYDKAAILSQGPEYEAIGGHRTLESVYSFNPVPKQFRGTPKAKHILGCQAQLWSEYMKTWDKVEYRAFPRVAALAEVAWTATNRKNFDDFKNRLKPMMGRYKASGINAFDVFNPPVIKRAAAKRPEAKGGLKAETSLPTHKNYNKILAIDGNVNTQFWSSRPVNANDHFTVIFPKVTKGPLKLKVLTGSKKDGGDHLEKGVVESMSKKNEWKKIATFAKGIATATIPIGTTQIRIKATKAQPSWLIIREVEIKK